MQRLLQSGRGQIAQRRLKSWLHVGMAPRQLAFTLALGFAIAASAAGRNHGHMRAGGRAPWPEYAGHPGGELVAMPLQLVLLIPFCGWASGFFAPIPVVQPHQLFRPDRRPHLGTRYCR